MPKVSFFTKVSGKLLRAPLTSFEHAVGGLLQMRANSIDLSGVRSTPHPLSGELIVSLTSYPPRFKYLMPTLKCLLAQSIKPDRVVLWLSHGDRALLPDGVLALEQFGLTISDCDNLRSYKKIIPSLLAYPDAFIVTADDDVFYRRSWLSELVSEFDASRKEIVCHRAHKVRMAPDGMPAAYDQWESSTADNAPSPLVFPTGVGGVLYAPGVLHPGVVDSSRFMKLAPSADDIWLYWMGLLNGSVFRKIGPRWEPRTWPGTQTIALHRQNVINSANDQQISNLVCAFGFPAAQ